MISNGVILPERPKVGKSGSREDGKTERRKDGKTERRKDGKMGSRKEKKIGKVVAGTSSRLLKLYEATPDLMLPIEVLKAMLGKKTFL